MAHPIDAWHEFVESRDPGLLDALLADDVVFHSPVVHTPQRGKAITLLYLRGAMQVLGTPAFRYEREIRAERDALLEFSTQIDGIAINGVDLIRWDDAGRIVDFKVMVRPLKAVNALHQKMGELLAQMKQPSGSGGKAA
ncbi:MAG: nuclear transport factor 2 family protein [Deltaproteobacteria bacterium]|nr:MAG: nuclear transport factor 2 family protein [Deltaproteobacteria bacterium]